MSAPSDNRDALSVATEIAGACVGVRIRMLNRAVSRIYDEHLRSLGIKFSQMNILIAVTLRGPVQPIEVARALSMEKSTLSRNVRLLEENGWVASRAGESGNTQLLRITPKGRVLLAKALPAWREAQAHVTSVLGEGTSRALREAADRLRASVSL